MARRSKEALAIAQELRKELASTAKRTGKNLVFSAAEEAIMEQIQNAFDRLAVLQSDWDDCADSKVRARLASEMRLTESHIERLLRRIKTDVPAPRSATSARAAAAVKSRWDRELGRV